MGAPENINLLGGEGSGILCKAHFMKEVCFLPTPALLKINKFYSLRIILLGSDRKQSSSCSPGLAHTHVNSHCLLLCMPRKPAIKIEAMFFLTHPISQQVCGSMNQSVFSSADQQTLQVNIQANAVYLFIAIIHSVPLCLVTSVILFTSLVKF